MQSQAYRRAVLPTVGKVELFSKQRVEDQSRKKKDRFVEYTARDEMGGAKELPMTMADCVSCK